jgi:hypothetical protein
LWALSLQEPTIRAGPSRFVRTIRREEFRGKGERAIAAPVEIFSPFIEPSSFLLLLWERCDLIIRALL